MPRNSKSSPAKGLAELKAAQKAGAKPPAFPERTTPKRKPKGNQLFQAAEAAQPARAKLRAKAPAKKPGKTPATPKFETTDEVIQLAGGLPAVIEMVEAGHSMNRIAAALGITTHRFSRWARDDEQRWADFQKAWEFSAHLIAERGRMEIQVAPDDFGLKKAIALEQHDRWMASMRNRMVYGSRQIVDLNTTKVESPEEILAELQRAKEAALAEAQYKATLASEQKS